MIDINAVLIIMMIFLHWLADFVCQSDWEAVNKSKNNLALVYHTAKYSVLWFPFMLTVIGGVPALWFTLITFIAHTATDYVTSRVNARYWVQDKRHEFFVSVGFDQFLHYAQLIITYLILR